MGLHWGNDVLNNLRNIQSTYLCAYLLLICIFLYSNVSYIRGSEWRSSWRTPLMLACSKGDLPTVRALVTHGAQLLLRNKDGWNAFHVACRCERYYIYQKPSVSILMYAFVCHNLPHLSLKFLCWTLPLHVYVFCNTTNLPCHLCPPSIHLHLMGQGRRCGRCSLPARCWPSLLENGQQQWPHTSAHGWWGVRDLPIQRGKGGSGEGRGVFKCMFLPHDGAL